MTPVPYALPFKEVNRLLNSYKEQWYYETADWF